MNLCYELVRCVNVNLFCPDGSTDKSQTHALVLLLQMNDGVQSKVYFYRLLPMDSDESGEGHYDTVMHAINEDDLLTEFKKQLVSIGRIFKVPTSLF